MVRWILTNPVLYPIICVSICKDALTVSLDFKPSAIQQRAIIPIMRGRDVIAQAQSGQGKTATFSISALQLDLTPTSATQVLVLSQLKLAIRIRTVVLALGDYMERVVSRLYWRDFGRRGHQEARGGSAGRSRVRGEGV